MSVRKARCVCFYCLFYNSTDCTLFIYYTIHIFYLYISLN